MIGFDIAGFSLNVIGNFCAPVDRKEYTTVDIKIDKRFSNLAFILEGTNIFNTGYEELKDIPGSGRWYKFGIEYSF